MVFKAGPKGPHSSANSPSSCRKRGERGILSVPGESVRAAAVPDSGKGTEPCRVCALTNLIVQTNSREPRWAGPKSATHPGTLPLKAGSLIKKRGYRTRNSSWRCHSRQGPSHPLLNRLSMVKIEHLYRIHFASIPHTLCISTK